MWHEISRLAGDERITVLLTTHYLEEADRLAQRVAIVDAGRTLVEGEPERLKSTLRGDTLSIDLPTSDESPFHAVAALTAIPGVRDAQIDGSRLRARADDGARAVPAVLNALEKVGITAAAVTFARPSLDDVYLQHVGRSFKGAA
jgi:ABC-2 type transport system ATP-binding protein